MGRWRRRRREREKGKWANGGLRKIKLYQKEVALKRLLETLRS